MSLPFKIHRHLLVSIAGVLHTIFIEKKYADKAIEKLLKQNPKWGSRDRRFVAETTYNIVRYYRYLAYLANTSDNFEKMVYTYLLLKNYPISSLIIPKGISNNDVFDRKGKLEGLAVKESYPDWLCELAIKELGEKIWWQQAEALNNQAPVVLRINTLKTMKSILVPMLKKEDIETTEDKNFPDALLLEQRTQLFNSPLFKNGFFEIQDAGSQLIAPFLNVEPGMKVIDACAGAGGKTLHLAAITKNKGRIISLDVEQWKLDELKKRARRANASNVETRLIDTNKTIKRLENTADRLLLDVPCSGTGVIRRNPDTKWKLTPESLENTKTLQRKILSEYPTMLKTEGIFVYATCSILPSENRQQVDWLLHQFPNKYQILKEKTLLPSDGFDGFYMCAIKKLN